MSAQPIEERMKRVLIAEDDPLLQRLFTEAFTNEGYFVETSPNGREAYQRIVLDVGFFDLLVTDHQMPHVAGSDLVQKIRSRGFKGHIIVVSGHREAFAPATYQGLNVAHLVAKPFQVAKLMELVRGLDEPKKPDA